MRDLIRMSLLERWTGGDTFNVGFGRGAITVSADLRNSQHVGHNQVGHGEAIGSEPIALGLVTTRMKAGCGSPLCRGRHQKQ